MLTSSALGHLCVMFVSGNSFTTCAKPNVKMNPSCLLGGKDLQDLMFCRCKKDPAQSFGHFWKGKGSSDLPVWICARVTVHACALGGGSNEVMTSKATVGIVHYSFYHRRIWWLLVASRVVNVSSCVTLSQCCSLPSCMCTWDVKALAAQKLMYSHGCPPLGSIQPSEGKFWICPRV